VLQADVELGGKPVVVVAVTVVVAMLVTMLVAMQVAVLLAVGAQEQAELYREGSLPQPAVKLGGKPVVAVLVAVV
jgi:hypothetical protein